MPHEHVLAGSLYGKFFARRLHLSLLRRKPEEWVALQVRKQAEQREQLHGRKRGPAGPVGTTEVVGVDISKALNAKRGREDNTDEVQGAQTRKRKREADELDVIFEGVRENRFGRVGLPPKTTGTGGAEKVGAPVSGDILDAIKAAPKSESKARRKRKA
jgi:hypothetical protein